MSYMCFQPVEKQIHFFLSKFYKYVYAQIPFLSSVSPEKLIRSFSESNTNNRMLS